MAVPHIYRRRFACLLLTALLASTALAGCGGGAAGAPDATAAPTATPASTSQPLRPVGDNAEDAEVPTVLPVTQDAGRTYLDETLFIGDSNTARYMMYADETGTPFTTLANNIGVVSMGVGAITTLKCERFKGYGDTKYTIPDAVAMLKPRRIIIGFGTNNLSGTSTDATNFIKTYKNGLAAIAEAWPYADIIVNAIPPLDQQRENSRLSMVQVDAYNEALVTMCEEEGYHFLNTAEVLRDSTTGWAKKDYTLSDGVHLSKAAVTALFNYVRTHAYITEDRRPQPLGTIPEPDGVPLGLINQDPIAVRGAKVPVEFVATKGGKLEGETSQQVKKGAACSAVTAVPDKGFQFDHWEASQGQVSSDARLSFTVPEDATANGVVLTAYFVPDEHEHKWVEVPDTRVESTSCTQAGHAMFQCEVCEIMEERELAPLPHTYDQTKAFTVTEKHLEDHPDWKKWLGQNVVLCTKCRGGIRAAMASPTPATEASPTPGTQASPTPGTQASPTPGTQASPTPGTQVSPTPGQESNTPTPGNDTPAPGTNTPTPGNDTPTPGTSTPTTPTTPGDGGGTQGGDPDPGTTPGDTTPTEPTVPSEAPPPTESDPPAETAPSGTEESPPPAETGEPAE